MRKSIICLFLAALLAGCSGDSTVFRNDVSFGVVKGGIFVTDAGLDYIIVENLTDTPLEDGKRLMLTCDLLSRRGPKEYEARVIKAFAPLTKQPLRKGEEDDGTLGDDPIGVTEAWMGGGYLNLGLKIAAMKNSNTVHLVNLVETDGPFPDDTLYLRLRHNAYGEVMGNEGMTGDKFQLAKTYACFPLDKFREEGKEAKPFKLCWSWYVEVPGYLINELEEKWAVSPY